MTAYDDARAALVTLLSQTTAKSIKAPALLENLAGVFDAQLVELADEFATQNDIIASIAALDPLQPSYQAAQLLKGEDGVAFDFAAREGIVNDYVGLLSRTARPSNILTVARTTAKNAVDRSRTLTSNAGNTIAYCHDPYTGEPLGAGIHATFQNDCLYTEDFTDASWVKTETTITSNVAVAPDGATTADKIVESATASVAHNVGRAFTAAASNTHVFSVYFLAAERSYAYISVGAGFNGTAIRVHYNLTSGAVVVCTGSPVATGAIRYKNGWWRCWFSATSSGSPSASNYAFGPAVGTSSSDDVYSGDGVSGIYAWGANRMATQEYPHTYIKSTSAATAVGTETITLSSTYFPLSSVQGTLLANVLCPPVYLASGLSRIMVELSDGSLNNRIFIYYDTTTANIKGRLTSGGVVQATVTVAVTLGQRHKIAMSWLDGVLSMSVNGGSVTTASYATLPVGMNTLKIGGVAGSSAKLNGWMKSAGYISRSLQATELTSWL